jgi:hypothetical protein
MDELCKQLEWTTAIALFTVTLLALGADTFIFGARLEP